jgi:hypothetical protein
MAFRNELFKKEICASKRFSNLSSTGMSMPRSRMPEMMSMRLTALFAPLGSTSTSPLSETVK